MEKKHQQYRDRGGDDRGRYREGRGDRGDRGRGGQRGDRGGGNFQQKQSVVSTTGPGPVQLYSNHFKLTLKTQNNNGFLYMYSIDFGPFIDRYDDKNFAIKSIKDQLTKTFKKYIFVSSHIFSPYFIEGQIELNATANNTDHEIKISLQTKIDLNELDPKQLYFQSLLDFMNLIVKKAVQQKDFKQVGRLPKYFQVKEQNKIPEYQLTAWPGYELQTKLFNEGLFLNVETCTKFIQDRTILEDVEDYMRQNYTKNDISQMFYHDEGKQQSKVVITTYNSRTYQIDELSFEHTPKNTTCQWSYGGKQYDTNLIEYFNIKYKIDLSKVGGQPCLVVHKDKTGDIYLPASLCHEAKLPDDFVKDAFKMRNLAKYRISDPSDRYQRISQFINKMQNNEEFQDWNVHVEQRFAQVKGQKLHNPKVLDNNNNEHDFMDYERGNIKHSQPIQLKYEQWTMVYSSKDFNETTQLFENMQKASGKFGVRVEDPQWVEINQPRNDKDFINAIKDQVTDKTIIAVVVIFNKGWKKYIKAQLDKMNVPSQFVTTETIRRTKGFGAYSNILKQINAKCRQDLFRLNIKLSPTMIVGVDVVNEGRDCIIGLTASYNKYITQFYNDAVKISLHKEMLVKENKDVSRSELKEKQELKITEDRTQIISEFIKKAVIYFKQSNKIVPENIIVYRDGVGGPTMQRKVEESEVQGILNQLSQYDPQFKPKIIYVLVNKRITHRLFEKFNGENTVLNPNQGTLVDSLLVEKQDEKLFDFFLIPHRATVATALPVHFKVIHNSSTYKKHEIEYLTYHLCFAYANFQGSIKVPNATMYAQKLANYIHEISVPANQKLNTSLHFL